MAAGWHGKPSAGEYYSFATENWGTVAVPMLATEPKFRLLLGVLQAELQLATGRLDRLQGLLAVAAEVVGRLPEFLGCILQRVNGLPDAGVPRS